MKVSGAQTKREAIEVGLKTLPRLSKEADIRKLRGQREAKRHGEAGGMRSGDQLFRIDARFVAEVRAEAKAVFIEHADCVLMRPLPSLPRLRSGADAMRVVMVEVSC